MCPRPDEVQHDLLACYRREKRTKEEPAHFSMVDLKTKKRNYYKINEGKRDTKGDGIQKKEIKEMKKIRRARKMTRRKKG